MRISLSHLVGLTVVAATALSAGVGLSQSQYPANLLNQKGNFSAVRLRPWASPCRCHDFRRQDCGLFPVRSTGVSTEAIRSAAEAFLATLNTIDLSRTHFAIDDPEWRDWSNVMWNLRPPGRKSRRDESRAESRCLESARTIAQCQGA